MARFPLLLAAAAVLLLLSPIQACPFAGKVAMGSEDAMEGAGRKLLQVSFKGGNSRPRACSPTRLVRGPPAACLQPGPLAGVDPRG